MTFCSCKKNGLILKKNFKLYDPFFYGWGSTASRLEPLRGGSLLFTTKFPEIPGNPRDKVNFKIYDITTWLTNACNIHIV